MSIEERAMKEYRGWVRLNVINQGFAAGHITFGDEEKPLMENLLVIMSLGFPYLKFKIDKARDTIWWRGNHDQS